jgi:hypothetical protein
MCRYRPNGPARVKIVAFGLSIQLYPTTDTPRWKRVGGVWRTQREALEALFLAPFCS